MLIERPFLTRLRISLFGMTATEMQQERTELRRMQERIRREVQLEAAEDELRIIHDYDKEKVAALRAELLALPTHGARLTRLVEIFGGDASRIAAAFQAEILR